MKKPAIYRIVTTVVTLCLFFIWQGLVFGQDKVTIDKTEVRSWFQQNWMWVAGAGVVLLLVILLSSGRVNRRRTDTIVKDDLGNVKRITTTEVEE